MRIEKFNFHCGGLTSQEEMNVIYERNDTIVLSDENRKLSDEQFESLDLNEHEFNSGCDYWVFDKSSGKCLNDLLSFGCHRTITV